MTKRTERRRAERAVTALEAQRRRLAEQRRPIPHALMQRMKAARLHALSVGRAAR